MLPDDICRQLWDIVLTLLLAYTALITPYQVAFIEYSSVWEIIDLTLDLLFAMDVIINCFTAYFDHEDNLIIDRK